MTDYDTTEVEGTDLEPRDVRALTECMTVLPEGGDIYTVVGENGDTYSVDARAGRCTCPDYEYRHVRCKHQARVAYATGEQAIPDGVDVDAHLGEHVDATLQVAATDGGEILVAGDEGEVLRESDGEDEACEALPGEYPCADCYTSGEKDFPEEADR